MKFWNWAESLYFFAALAILHLENNQIATIPPNTFSQGKDIYHLKKKTRVRAIDKCRVFLHAGCYMSISLDNNQLKRFESNVFKSLLIRNNPTMVGIRGSNNR